MAEPHPQVEREVEVEHEERSRPRLRRLEFVQVAAAQAAVCLAGLYALAKDHVGPLRPGVDAAESAVKGVVGPVYGRFHGVPLDVLAFVDRKVDGTVQELDRHLPSTLKAATAQACAVAQGVPEVAREITTQVQQSGVVGAARAAYGKIEPVAKDLYVRYEPAAEHLAVSTWRSLNSLPLFPHVAHIVVPTAAYCAEKYNKVITSAAEQGYTGAQYLPAIPTERIAKVFGEHGVPPASSPETEPLEGANVFGEHGAPPASSPETEPLEGANVFGEHGAPPASSPETEPLEGANVFGEHGAPPASSPENE